MDDILEGIRRQADVLRLGFDAELAVEQSRMFGRKGPR
jgi:hypothetical protein